MSADLIVTVDMVPSLIGLSLQPLAEALCTRIAALGNGTTKESVGEELMGGGESFRAAVKDLELSFGYTLGEGMGAVYA
jgi:hypothetical protein